MADFSTKVIKYLEANGKTKDELGADFENPNVAIVDDGTGAVIKIWNTDKLGFAKPTDSQLASYETAGNTEEKNNTVRVTRKAAYGDIGDQLDLLYKDIVANKLDTTGEWAKKIKAVKDSNPKESS